MKTNLYLVTVMEINGDEIVKKITARTKNEAVAKAFLDIRADEVECLVLDGQHLRDNAGVLFEDFPTVINDGLQIGATGWYENMLYSRKGERIFVPNNRIYIDTIKTKQRPVQIKRGDAVEVKAPVWGGVEWRRGIAWLQFQNQHGRGWVLLDENNPAKNFSVYTAEIVTHNIEPVEFNELTNELVYLYILDDEDNEGEYYHIKEEARA